MNLLLLFSLTLVAAVLVSEIADRTILSTTVLFLVAGLLADGRLLNLIPEMPQDPDHGYAGGVGALCRLAHRRRACPTPALEEGVEGACPTLAP